MPAYRQLTVNEPRLQRTGLSAAAYAEIRRRILTLALSPGQRISAEGLAKELGVSRTPVREAFVQLARELLIDVAPNGAIRVAEPSAAYLVAINDVRKLLEGWAAAAAAERIHPAQVSELRSKVVVAQEHSLRAHDLSAAAEADEALHDAIIGASGNQIVVQMLAQVAGYRVWVRQLSLQSNPISDENHEEHLAVLDALEARDPDRARAAMVAHIAAGTRRQMALLRARSGSAIEEMEERTQDAADGKPVAAARR